MFTHISVVNSFTGFFTRRKLLAAYESGSRIATVVCLFFLLERRTFHRCEARVKIFLSHFRRPILSSWSIQVGTPEETVCCSSWILLICCEESHRACTTTKIGAQGNSTQPTVSYVCNVYIRVDGNADAGRASVRAALREKGYAKRVFVERARAVCVCVMSIMANGDGGPHESAKETRGSFFSLCRETRALPHYNENDWTAYARTASSLYAWQLPRARDTRSTLPLGHRASDKNIGFLVIWFISCLLCATNSPAASPSPHWLQSTHFLRLWILVCASVEYDGMYYVLL